MSIDNILNSQQGFSGLEKLIKTFLEDRVSMDELSPWFKKYKYTCHEVENFLCIEKDNLKIII